MNTQSLAQTNIKNQQVSSMNDDPFGLGVEFHREVKYMSHEKRLLSFVAELASTYANFFDGEYNLDLDELPEEERGELAALYLDYSGRELTECVNGNDFAIDNDYTCALLSMLKDNCEETREFLAKTIRKNILNYYSESLQQLLNEACEELLVMEYEEAQEGDQDLNYTPYFLQAR